LKEFSEETVEIKLYYKDRSGGSMKFVPENHVPLILKRGEKITNEDITKTFFIILKDDVIFGQVFMGKCN
jgi:hypothetical protein